ncbi:MAG: anhydro-N-acetylmuramic acid kinase [Proteobacteria bacterium]|nr:anhydro-N-acetylmuramic acid kinase [Pseudomonadota bacterium]
MPPNVPSTIYIGLMSGTSLDGVDIAIVDFATQAPKMIHCATWPFEKSLRARIRMVTLDKSASIDALCQLDVELGITYADVVNRSLEKVGLEHSRIRAIGSHGQTIRHRPSDDLPYSLQIGDPNTLAARTGILTIGDFRRMDIALGGQGAPLAPAFHNVIFRSDSWDRAIINIGGIANITCLPANAESEVVGFDTGPGNTLLDYWINKHQGLLHDDRGNWAASGSVIESLLSAMLSNEPYFNQLPPKSTGTDYFSPDWLSQYLAPEFSPQDVQATLLELTVVSIAKGLAKLASVPQECYICGGGVNNHFLIERLKQQIPDCDVDSTEALGIDPDYVEALAFAWLAQQRINHHAGNLPSVTQAKASVVLGGAYWGHDTGLESS